MRRSSFSTKRAGKRTRATGASLSSRRRSGAETLPIANCRLIDLHTPKQAIRRENVKTLLTAGILLSVVIAAPLLAEQTCKPVTGHFEAFVVPPGGGDNNFCPPNPGQFCTA